MLLQLNHCCSTEGFLVQLWSCRWSSVGCLRMLCESLIPPVPSPTHPSPPVCKSRLYKDCWIFLPALTHPKGVFFEMGTLIRTGGALISHQNKYIQGTSFEIAAFYFGKKKGEFSVHASCCWRGCWSLHREAFICVHTSTPEGICAVWWNLWIKKVGKRGSRAG